MWKKLRRQPLSKYEVDSEVLFLVPLLLPGPSSFSSRLQTLGLGLSLGVNWRDVQSR